MRRLFQALSVLLLGLCSLASTAGDYLLQRDIAYGTHPRQVLDVYGDGGTQAPVIVLVHGGGWAHGDKGQRGLVERKVQRWVAQGVLVVSLDYRLVPQADPLQQAEDVAMAVTYLHRHVAQWGGDPRRLILIGHSAGAHLVSLLAASPARFGLGDDAWLGSVALDSGALDVEAIMRQRHARFYDQAFGADPCFWRSVSPLQQLQRAGPPMLLVCSAIRPDRPCEAAGQFVEAARRLGRRAELLPQPLSHRRINTALGEESAYTRSVEAFMGSLDASLARRLAAARR